jgi:uncharacterized protein YdaU (DUF1376 family)
MVGGTWLLSARLCGAEVPALNYYERHIGDYIKDTAHLSLLEHGVYARLLDVYYLREEGIPKDQACRLISATGKAEKAAVDSVLREFFELDGDLWIQKRCDEVIAEYKASEPERETRRANEAGRVRRHRDERSRIFGCLHSVGEYPAWNLGMAELRALHKSRCNGTCNVTGAETETLRTPEVTASHSPLPTPHIPKSREPASPAQGLDPKKAIFDLGVNLMGESKRALIGKAVATVGLPKVSEVLGFMAANTVADPASYFAKATQPKAREVVC